MTLLTTLELVSPVSLSKNLSYSKSFPVVIGLLVLPLVKLHPLHFRDSSDTISPGRGIPLPSVSLFPTVTTPEVLGPNFRRKENT